MRAALLSFTLVACGAPGVTPAAPERAASEAAELYSEPEEYRAAPVSAELGRAHFAERGVGDPYGAGVPYPVYRAWMAEMPDMMGGDFTELAERFGFIANPENSEAPPVGFHLTRDPNTGVDFVVINCQVCHAERVQTDAGDEVVLGLGNRRVRIHAYAYAFARLAADPRFERGRLAQAAAREAERLGLAWPPQHRRALVAATVDGVRARFAPREAALARLADGLPGRVATIEAFALALEPYEGREVETADVIGWARVPDVATWRYRESNSFDAVSIGSPVAAVAGADFAAGVRPRWYREHRHIATSMFLYLRGFERRLPFPGAIDEARASRGYDAFESRCAGCHGHYARPGEAPRVSYEERVVPVGVVGTDAARLDAVTESFVVAANRAPETEGLAIVRRTGGYVPRPLVHVWARGQYGHNGQWPDLAVLATPPDQRPVRYVVTPEAPLDLARVGQRWRPASEGPPDEGEYLYDGAQPGFGVQGHTFLSDAPEDERAAILEYLKTL